MDDDDDIQSNPSPLSSSPRPNGRITVTVAAAAPPPHTNTLTLALPIQHQPPPLRISGGSSGGGGGREDCWSEGATAVLIDAWGERYLELSRGNLKQKHWKEVSDIVSSRGDFSKIPKTDIQCKNRIDTVKKKYKSEKAKLVAGGGPSKWPFYERLDQLIGPSSAKKSSSAGLVTPVLAKGGGGGGVPVGIPVGIRSAPKFQKLGGFNDNHFQFKRPVVPVDSDSEGSDDEPSQDSTDQEESYGVKRPRVQVQAPPREVGLMSGGRGGAFFGGKGKEKEKEKEGKGNSSSSSEWGNSVRELTRAILKFGEAYEHAESAKVQQLVEMEKQRMKFAKELELQRMQFFMKTQLELSQLKRRRSGGGGGNNSSNNNHHTSNNSESSN